MLRRERSSLETAPRFAAVRRWRLWRAWPGIMGIATAVALWVFLATGVVAPLGDALARLRSRADVAPVRALPVDAATTRAGEVAQAEARPPARRARAHPSPSAR
jgi:hypothetical protein